MPNDTKAYAIWALTPKGARLGLTIQKALLQADLFVSLSADVTLPQAHFFKRLKTTLTEEFRHYGGHIFIMSTGIVVRMLAPLIDHKVTDPAVLVVDELGRHAISLLAGHIGGANELAHRIARRIGAVPVITTASDINELPAIDLIAARAHLTIENPAGIKYVQMAFLKKKPVQIYDPFNILAGSLPANDRQALDRDTQLLAIEDTAFFQGAAAGLYIDDRTQELPPQVLVLRPPSLIAGIGCNRHTGMDEIKGLLQTVMDAHRLSSHSLVQLASIDLKKDEAGLLALGRAWDIPLVFYGKDQLKQVQDQCTPSKIVEKHVGVKSVCEAAAILAAAQGKLIVPKHATRNVTVAIARKSYTS